MSKINIYIVCHKNVLLPKSSIFHPIQVGTENAASKLEYELHDNEGENISSLNPKFCELTAQYWAWKNDIDADYYGFMHYRRFFDFSCLHNVNAKKKLMKPYTTIESLQEYKVKDDELLIKDITKYDAISVERVKMDCTVYEQFIQFHDEKNIVLIEDIIKQMYPSYIEDMEFYFNSREIYFLNMFIMKKKLYFEYMEWLFNILYEFEKRKDYKYYNEQQMRMPAFLGERLFGIYFTHLKKDKKYKLGEMPFVFWEKPLEIKKEIKYNKRELTKKNNKTVVPVVLASDDYYVPYMDVLLHSIMENADKNKIYDIVILEKNICETNKNKLKESLGLNDNIYIRFINVSDTMKKYSVYVHPPFKPETYFRLLIQDLLPEYDKVIYLDCDMVVEHDIGELINLDIKEFYLAACPDIFLLCDLKNNKAFQLYIKDTVKLKNSFKYFQAGCLLINTKKFRENFTTSDLLELAQKNKYTYVDQDLLNFICQGKVMRLEQQWNIMNDIGNRVDNAKNGPALEYLDYLIAKENPYVIHYAGNPKPWDNAKIDMADYFWKYARNSKFYNILLKRMLMNGEIK